MVYVHILMHMIENDGVELYFHTHLHKRTLQVRVKSI